MTTPVRKPLRLLVVLPSWVGDVTMATPALRAIRDRLAGTFIGGLCRPGIDQVLAGSSVFDELHVERASGVFGPKFVAAKVRPRQYDTALLLTNSLGTALVARIAGIPRRMGYDRDGRGFLLTDRLKAPKRDKGGWAVIPACEYYWRAARALLDGDVDSTAMDPARWTLPAGACMELGVSPEQERASMEILAAAGCAPGAAYALLNPGGNDPAKRWPADRFADLARWLRERWGVKILVNGSPAEMELAGNIVGACGGVSLPALGITLGALKGVVRGASVVVTNDTGPRHLAAAFGVPLVSLFGPTDHRWTIIPMREGAREEIVLADPTLPESEVANDHPERCSMDRIEVDRVKRAAERVLGELA
ncbi:MAG: glycosyltransferase family 9 protein [Planctomycetes bacterium]|nr:glycosyltransferase family 9 protein [Planctomycetota bacterium]